MLAVLGVPRRSLGQCPVYFGVHGYSSPRFTPCLHVTRDNAHALRAGIQRLCQGFPTSLRIDQTSASSRIATNLLYRLTAKARDVRIPPHVTHVPRRLREHAPTLNVINTFYETLQCHISILRPEPSAAVPTLCRATHVKQRTRSSKMRKTSRGGRDARPGSSQCSCASASRNWLTLRMNERAKAGDLMPP